MRFLIDPVYHDELRRRDDHTNDCYVRPGEYLHHMYLDGVKYVVAQAMQECFQEAQEKNDAAALRHLELHMKDYEILYQEAQKAGKLADAQVLGDPPPEEDADDTTASGPQFVPPAPRNVEETGLSMPFIVDLVLRTIYNRGRSTGGEIANALRIPFPVLTNVFNAMRKQNLIDMVGQRAGGLGDSAFEYEIKPPKGTAAVEDALKKSEYVGPAPVPFLDYVESIKLQTVKNMVVTRRNIKHAFSDLVITDTIFNEIGPAINSAQSIFFFGFPGNGKTSVAERITRLMGSAMYIPYAVEANGLVIKVYDPIVHQPADEAELSPAMQSVMKTEHSFDGRFVKIRRPTIVVGGELTMDMLALKYNEFGKFYEAPVHMKANGGIFMIDDFGRQQVRPMDLLNRWIVPLEKKYDYLTTITGIKIEIPFDQLLIFSTNLDPAQLADEAFLRRIKFKIEIRDPDEAQYRKIWQLVCRGRGIKYEDRAIDYLIEKWYKPFKRPFRMCHPRDLLDQMINIAKYNMEKPAFNPDLIDAGCATYFITAEKRDFGAKVRVD